VVQLLQFKTNELARARPYTGRTLDIERLAEHASKIENGFINITDANAVCGGEESPIFDAIDIDHYVMPGLHMMGIGKGNDGLDNLMAEVLSLYT
jgi:hypothetical protein